ncbi:MAG TPA: adenylate/guanylate cyclase domain-containing protein [Solirubrobacterales bacterium]
MALTALTWFYSKLGRFYPATYLTLELQSAFFVTVGTLALLSIYYDALADEYLPIGAVALATTALAVVLNLWRTFPLIKPINHWIRGERDGESSVRAWSAAITLPLNLIKRDLWIPIFVVVIPTSVAALLFTDLPWYSFFPIFSSALIAVGYGGILHYLMLETGMRPVLVDINHSLPPRQHADTRAMPLRWKLLATMPLINVITAFVVQALSTDNSTPAPEVDFMIAVAIATAISLELSVMLSKSILRPIGDLQDATHRVAEGDYDVNVPVTTGDELGELAASFNEMAAGLAEREKIRDAFGTYLDREVAEYILSEGFDEEGMATEVSVLFVDVVDFTSFAARAEARDVVACLNELFEIVVPVIARYGGHVDKFEGDGLLAVFGAPERMPDHADRALRAALEMTRRVNGEAGIKGDGAGVSHGEIEFRIGAGVNTGEVVAGAIGGGGRLNFSVIGDPVNVAARVEAVTRETDDDVLITEASKAALRNDFELIERGRFELKGIDEPVSLFAPVPVAAGDGRPAPSPVPGTLAGSEEAILRSRG